MSSDTEDFIIAIKNYEDIVISLPLLPKEAESESLPELYKLFITISILLRDYDVDLIDLLHKKWDYINKNNIDNLIDIIDNIKEDSDDDLDKYLDCSLLKSEIKLDIIDNARLLRG